MKAGRTATAWDKSSLALLPAIAAMTLSSCAQSKSLACNGHGETTQSQALEIVGGEIREALVSRRGFSAEKALGFDCNKYCLIERNEGWISKLFLKQVPNRYLVHAPFPKRKSDRPVWQTFYIGSCGTIMDTVPYEREPSPQIPQILLSTFLQPLKGKR